LLGKAVFLAFFKKNQQQDCNFFINFPVFVTQCLRVPAQPPYIFYLKRLSLIPMKKYTPARRKTQSHVKSARQQQQKQQPQPAPRPAQLLDWVIREDHD
jgi:hypothetical protein